MSLSAMTRVLKRNGEFQEVSFDKVLNRIKKLSEGLNVNPFEIAQKVVSRIYNGVKTEELDEIASYICSSSITTHPDYGKLASRIVISNNHKNTTNDFREIIDELYNNKDIHNEQNPLVHKILYDTVEKHHNKLNKVIDYHRDYNLDYFGYKTLERSYLIKINGKLIERPQHMYMRVSLGIHMDIKKKKINIKDAIETYQTMSKQYYTHATPTLFNAGTSRNQQSSCYLLDMSEDSVDGMYKTIGDCAKISKYSGGIGLALHKIRSKGQLIRGTNGKTDGLVPLLRTLNATARHINQCFVPETKIITDSGLKAISNIEVYQDKVLTSDGTFKLVNQMHINDVKKEILEIETGLGVEPIRVTKEHQLLVVRNVDITQDIEYNLNKLDLLLRPEYISSSELGLNDLVIYPIPKYNSNNSKLLRDFMVSNPDVNDEFITDDVEEAHNYQYVMMMNGMYVSCKKENDKYILQEADESEYLKFKNHIFGKVKSIKHINYEGKVYDICVNDNHNYVVSSFGIVHNSGKRNGSFCAYLETHHPDILEFLEARKNHGAEEERARDLFYALWVSDIFMRRVENGEMWSLMDPDMSPNLHNVYGEEYEKLYLSYEEKGQYVKQVPARDIWFKILDAQIETGTPYIVYKDHVNNKSNHQNFGTTKSSNLCVHPETLILTDKGHQEIQTLRDQKVNVWNGKEFSQVEVKKTGENQDLVKVSFSDGMELKCTPYHKFYIQNKSVSSTNLKKDILKSKYVKVIEAKDLQKGMKIVKCDYPIIEYEKELQYAYTQGAFAGDGTYSKSKKEECPCPYQALNNKAYCKRHLSLYEKDDDKPTERCQAIGHKDKPLLSLYHEKIELEKYLDYTSKGEVLEKENRLTLTLPKDLKDKFFVPMNYSIKSKMEWFSGYADMDGCIVKQAQSYSLQICSIDKNFLQNIKLMLQTCGINSKINNFVNDEERLLPDGKGGFQYYKCKEAFRLLIAGYELKQLIELGFKPNRLIINDFNIKQSQLRFVLINNIQQLDEKSDTYCFTEPKRNAGIFNGIFSKNCAEITQFTDEKQIAVCNLASICLPKYIITNDKGEKFYDHELLGSMVRIIVRNINKIIDNNFNPTPECEFANQQQRPMGIGVQGLADVFAMFDLPYDSPQSRQLNNDIFETIYYYAISETIELAKTYGSYPRYEGSPFSKGILQFDMWKYEHKDSKYDWNQLKEDIQKYGARNSLMTALMPTASTSQICGYTESFEPLTSMLYKRKTLAGEFIVINKYLTKKLLDLNLWNKEIKDKIIMGNGSIQHIPEIPKNIKDIFKTIWEIPQKSLIEMSADRGKYIDQSQSFNLWFENPTYDKITSALFHGWKLGLKTGSYYLRSKPKAKTQQFTIDPTLERANVVSKNEEKEVNEEKERKRRQEEERKEREAFAKLTTKEKLKYAREKALKAQETGEPEPCLMCSG
jgi:ribonucleoside-diphosphate reductase alpha chain